MTIREAIRYYMEEKALYIGKSYLDTMLTTNLCVIIPLNNGIEIFIDECTFHDTDYPDILKGKVNKKGIYRRMSFEITRTDEDSDVVPVIPESMKASTEVSSCNGVMYFVCDVKEKVVNEFINDNGGINIPDYERKVNKAFSLPEKYFKYGVKISSDGEYAIVEEINKDPEKYKGMIPDPKRFRCSCGELTGYHFEECCQKCNQKVLLRWNLPDETMKD